MAAPAPLWLLLPALLSAPKAGGGGGEKLLAGPRRAAVEAPRLEAGRRAGTYQAGGPGVSAPDTAKPRSARPDTARVQPAAVPLVPDAAPAEAEADEKLTRRSALTIVASVAVLTLTTLLLYNVRSR
ncbi:hypothetical protein SAMN02745146_0942 [Hymenobacter daecheongensis DSM 21074]|uniref:Uncharacterized protein n=1 Tax=Hymenobacter daecheongensis DSM 21074 TaxID=1121955 RepID=A0A1M6BBD6_9BACT|nr:hypothetical protein [Hymenobacter daecheongensis]SHI46032.1 hypothetical protein SAMN02745146_0942 [Hymenobacter daecheongensis DSM 21074]